MQVATGGRRANGEGEARGLRGTAVSETDCEIELWGEVQAVWCKKGPSRALRRAARPRQLMGSPFQGQAPSTS